MAVDRKELDFGGVSQEAFLQEVRTRMNPGRRRSPYPASSRLWPEEAEERVSFAEKAQLFQERLKALGGTPFHASSAAEAYAWAKEFLAGQGVTRVLLGDGDWGEAGALFAERGIAVERWDEVRFEHGTADRSAERVNAWGAGLTWVDYAVADLGSVAICSSPGQGRSVSLVPPVFVAFIPAERLFYTRRAVLEEVAKRHREGRGPSSLTFITGPSRSADIENDLTIGVHGPGVVAAVIVGEITA